MGESFELEHVDWITAGAVGEPGQRTFYIQAVHQDALVSLLVEKGQVRVLSQLAQQLLANLDVTVTPDDLDAASQQLKEPVEPLWRAGSMSLGVDPDGQRFLLEAEEFTGDEEVEGGKARFWLTREQMVSMAAYAAFSVEAGARESCRLCGRPIDPVTGHVCPSSNGHGPLTT